MQKSSRLENKKNKNNKKRRNEKMKVVNVPLDEDALDGICEIECPYCSCGRTVEPDANYVVSCEECRKQYRIVGCC